MENLFRLDRSTGKLYWVNPPKYHPRMLHQEAGMVYLCRSKMYWRVSINKKKILRSHIVFYMVNKRWPKQCIDHINGNSLDDRPENLREVTHEQNAWNRKIGKPNKSLPMGIRISSSKKYVARISYKRKQITIGTFNNIKDAEAAYLNKRKELYGEYY